MRSMRRGNHGLWPVCGARWVNSYHNIWRTLPSSDLLRGEDSPNADELGDILIGGAGNDTLIGGQGRDLMDGGTGVNTLLSRKRYAVLHLRRRLQDVYDEYLRK